MLCVRYMLSVKLMVIVWIPAVFWNKYAPSITGQSISTVVLSKRMNFYRRYKYILSYYNIQTYRRRTFSTHHFFQLQWKTEWQVFNSCGDKTGGSGMFLAGLSLITRNIISIFVGDSWNTLQFICLFWRSFLSIIGWEALFYFLVGR